MTKTTLANISIRTHLKPGDLGYIAHLHGKVYAKECNYGLNFEKYVLKGMYEFLDTYETEKDRVWICEHNQNIVGFLLAGHKNDLLQFRYFIILPEYRGLGVADLLMQNFVDFMEEKTYTQAFLWTTTEQIAAIKLYMKYGFELEEEVITNDTFNKEITEQKFILKK